MDRHKLLINSLERMIMSKGKEVKRVKMGSVKKAALPISTTTSSTTSSSCTVIGRPSSWC